AGRPLRIALVTGAEGGFAPEEAAAAVAAGAKTVGLGPRILRCETAPLAVLASVMTLTGNLERNARPPPGRTGNFSKFIFTKIILTPAFSTKPSKSACHAGALLLPSGRFAPWEGRKQQKNKYA